MPRFDTTRQRFDEASVQEMRWRFVEFVRVGCVT
jgi:hypothetical protein